MPTIKNLKTQFEARLAELQSEAEEIDDALREPHTPDVEDRATEIGGDEVLEGLGKAALEEIADIEAALKRIELGTYGECTTCGKEISPARLAAVPTAAQCIDCAD